MRNFTAALLSLTATLATSHALAQGFTNGSFEEPIVPINRYVPSIPGWTTSDTFEVWLGGTQGIEAYDGKQFIELNSRVPSTVRQSSSFGTTGAFLALSWAHRGRNGTDTARLDITTSTGDVVTTRTFSSSNGTWTPYRQVFTKTADILTYSFISVGQATARLADGNFLDSIRLVQLPDAAVDAGRAAQNVERQTRALELAEAADCLVFDAKNICVGAGARLGAGSDAGRGAGSLVAAYKLTDVRIGAFIDSSTVTRNVMGDVDNVVPIAGLFAAYGNPYQTGMKFRAAGGLMKDNINFDGNDFYAGSKTELNSSRFVSRIGYGFAVADAMILEPYAAASHIRSRQAGFVRTSIDQAVGNMTFDKFQRDTTTAGAGLDLRIKFNEQWRTSFGLSIDYDLNHSRKSLGYGWIEDGVSGSSPVEYLRSRTRPGASASVVYTPQPNTAFVFGISSLVEKSGSFGTIFNVAVLKGF